MRESLYAMKRGWIKRQLRNKLNDCTNIVLGKRVKLTVALKYPPKQVFLLTTANYALSPFNDTSDLQQHSSIFRSHYTTESANLANQRLFNILLAVIEKQKCDS